MSRFKVVGQRVAHEPDPLHPFGTVTLCGRSFNRAATSRCSDTTRVCGTCKRTLNSRQAVAA